MHYSTNNKIPSGSSVNGGYMAAKQGSDTIDGYHYSYVTSCRSYADIRKMAKEKNQNIRFNKVFNAAMKRVKANSKLCKTNYLDPHHKSGSAKTFYTRKAVDVLLEEYEKINNKE